MNNGTIIYAGGFELPDKNAAAHRVMANGKIFKTLGYRVVYLGITHSEPFYPGLRQANYADNVFEESHPRSNRQWLKRLCSTENLKKLVSSYDDVQLIILYNLPFETLRRVRKAFRGRTLKIIYDCTEWSADTDGSLAKRLFKRMDAYAIRHWLPFCTDGLIVISQCMQKAYAGRSKVVLRLPPLVDLEAPIWHQPRVAHPDYFEFCFAGVLDGNKESLDILVQAFCRLDDKKARLRIIGVSKEDFCEFYPNYRHTNTFIDERIHFMGRLSHADTIRHVLNCNCYIFIRPGNLRNNAGFPTKFVESYTCGVPIISTDVSDIRAYMVAAHKGWIIPTLSTATITAAMAGEIGKVQFAPAPNLDPTFHYASYIEPSRHWLQSLQDGI